MPQTRVPKTIGGLLEDRTWRRSRFRSRTIQGIICFAIDSAAPDDATKPNRSLFENQTGHHHPHLLRPDRSATNEYSPHFPGGSTAAFTLVELMVSVTVLSLIMVVLMSMTNQITQTWRSTTGKIEQFQEARDGFESMTRKLSQAT